MAARIIRDGAIVTDDWPMLADDQPLPQSGRVILPLARYESEAEEAPAGLTLGVLLPNTIDVETVPSAILALPLIALEFPAHADGRAYSQARILRDRRGYRGELRATGDVLRDQMHYMQRCGFNAFVVAPGRDLESALAALGDFSVAYQPACDTSRTVFSRRASAS